MKSETIDWGKVTPRYDNTHYNAFKSSYKNIRYKVKSQTSSYTVTSSDMGRIPNISYKVYGSVNYWRALLEYNGIQDPITDIYPGRVLELPSKDELVSVLLSPSGNTDVSNNVVLTI